MHFHQRSSFRHAVEREMLFGARAIGAAIHVPQSVVLRLATIPGCPIFKSAGTSCASRIQIKTWIAANPALSDELADTLYTMKDIARFLMTNETTVRRLVAERGLPVEKHGKTSSASKKKLAAWVKSNTEINRADE